MRKKILTIILICASIGFAICMYFIISTLLEYKHSRDANNQAVELVTKDTGKTKLYDHEAALKVNPDAKGMYYNPGTETFLPIVQRHEDNDYYLHRDFFQNYSRAGTLFIDGYIKEGLDANHVIIYGHEMADGTMFSNNKWYKDYDFYKENSCFYIYTPTGVCEYKIFTVFDIYKRSDIFKINQNEKELIKYAQETKDLSMYDTGVDVNDTKQVVSIVSCEPSNYNYRLVLQGTFIKYTPYEEIE